MPTFKETEQAGLTQKQTPTIGIFSSITAQAILRALDQIGDLGLTLLDLCCGTDDSSSAAVRQAPFRKLRAIGSSAKIHGKHRYVPAPAVS